MKKRDIQILVIGSNSAIVRDSINSFLSNGMKVVGVSKNNIKFAEIKNHKNFEFYKFDLVKKFNQIDDLCTKIHKKNPFISIIIHSQGGSLGYNKIFDKISKWEELWKLNFASSVVINNFFVSKFLKHNFGRVLHFGSTITNLKQGSSIYSSTKASLYDYVKKMGNNYSSKNIFFNCIKTSIVSDDYNNWNAFEKKSKKSLIAKILNENVSTKKFGRSQYFTPIIKYLCSKENQYVTGSIIDIDGGFIK